MLGPLHPLDDREIARTDPFVTRPDLGDEARLALTLDVLLKAGPHHGRQTPPLPLGFALELALELDGELEVEPIDVVG